MSEIKRIHTSCKDCPLATYEGKTQVGCRLDRVKAFARTAEVIEAYDEDKEFFVINDRVCNALMVASARPSATPEEVRKACSVRLAAIVVFSHQTIEELEHTLAQLGNLEAPGVHEAIIVHNRDDQSVASIHAHLVGLRLPYIWKLCVVKEEKATNARAIDLGVDQANQSGWYVVLLPGREVPTGLARDLDVALNDELEKFCVVLPPKDGEEAHLLVVQKAFHHDPEIGGHNQLGTLVERAMALAVADPWLVRKAFACS